MQASPTGGRPQSQAAGASSNILTLPQTTGLTALLDTEAINECAALAAAALGKDSVSIVLASLPQEFGVSAADLFPAAPVGVPRAQSTEPISPAAASSGLSVAVPPVAGSNNPALSPSLVSGVAFLHSLAARYAALSSVAASALADYHTEQTRKAAVAREEAEAQRQRDERDAAEKAAKKSGSHKKAAPSQSFKVGAKKY